MRACASTEHRLTHACVLPPVRAQVYEAQSREHPLILTRQGTFDEKMGETLDSLDPLERLLRCAPRLRPVLHQLPVRASCLLMQTFACFLRGRAEPKAAWAVPLHIAPSHFPCHRPPPPRPPTQC